MTDEQKELLIKDLCARLPYGIFVDTKSEFEPREVVSIGYKIQKDCVTIRLDYVDEEPIYEICSIENVKPYLRPMSSMTEEEQEIYNNMTYTEGERYISSEICSNVINFLNTYHFDYRGLIEQGLALPAPDGMYNFK